MNEKLAKKYAAGPPGRAWAERGVNDKFVRWQNELANQARAWIKETGTALSVWEVLRR